jgi:hypothetical protein
LHTLSNAIWDGEFESCGSRGEEAVRRGARTVVDTKTANTHINDFIEIPVLFVPALSSPRGLDLRVVHVVSQNGGVIIRPNLDSGEMTSLSKP